MTVIPITSASHFRTLTSSATYTVVDFYADWCGPCKVISPVFEQLAAQESKPGRLVFAKVNVDQQREVAGIYGISAMPTFLILKGTKVTETVRGANPSALRTAILSAAADAARGPGGGGASAASFAGKGQTLRAGNAGGRPVESNTMLPNISFDTNALFAGPAAFSQGRGFAAAIVRFVGLYVSTLLSFDPVKTAEASPYAVRRTNVRSR